jgi:hypothetical protein
MVPFSVYKRVDVLLISAGSVSQKRLPSPTVLSFSAGVSLLAGNAHKGLGYSVPTRG